MTTTPPEPTVPIPMRIEFTATFSGLVDVPITTVIEATKRMVDVAARQGLPQPDIDHVLDEVASVYDSDDWDPVLDYEVDEIEHVLIDDIDDPDDIKAVTAIITAELERLADEADPKRTRFRPTVGQMDIFGLEVTQ